jgi:hypothetical protein
MKMKTKKNLLKSGIVISGLCALIAGFGDHITVRAIEQMYEVDIPKNEATSIGIIGGADGPTQVFVAGKTTASKKPFWVMLFLLCMGIFAVIHKKVSKDN